MPTKRTGSIASWVPPALTSDATAREVLRGERARRRVDDLPGLDHAPDAALAAGERPDDRPHDDHAARPQQRHVGLRGGVLPHARVHRRGDHHRAARGQQAGGGEVVAEPVGHAREEVGRGRGDEHQVGAAGERDVQLARVRRVPEVDAGRAAGDAREGHPGDEALPGGGEHGLDGGPAALELARDQRRLEGRDAAADDQQHLTPRERVAAHRAPGLAAGLAAGLAGTGQLAPAHPLGTTVRPAAAALVIAAAVVAGSARVRP
ncbi:MAG: hypothetical protein V9F06_00295 [Thermomicrobiales bacterium]